MNWAQKPHRLIHDGSANKPKTTEMNIRANFFFYKRKIKSNRFRTRPVKPINLPVQPQVQGFQRYCSICASQVWH